MEVIMSLFSSIYTRILVALLGLGVVSIYPLYHAFNGPKTNSAIFSSSLKNKVSEGQSVAHALIEQLDAEHMQCLSDLQEAFPIANNQWQETFAKIDQIKKADTLLGKGVMDQNKHTLVQKAQEVLVSSGINPARVTIETVDKPKSACDACAGQGYRNNKVEHFLQINIPVLEQKPEHIQEALLKHETMHLINYDSLEQVFIEALLKRNGIAQDAYSKHPAFAAYNKHTEFRADLMAGHTDITIAKNLKNAFELHIEQYPNAPISQSHPSSPARLDSMNQLISYLENEQQSQLA